ncbi:MAG: biotin/lipoyl-binding protein [Chloroflexi bacterium]|nr:biotin/lipoyl-binding protein [Chloroflexota bacterium]
MPTTLKVKVGRKWYEVEIGDLDAPVIEVLVDGHPVQVEVDRPASDTRMTAGPVRMATARPSKSSQGKQSKSSRPEPGQRAVSSSPQPVKIFRSPMPGVIVSVSVNSGDQVVPGDTICVLEAMKMQQTLKAEWAGVIKAVHVQQGQQVQSGETIVELE